MSLAPDKPILKATGLCSGTDFFLAYSPEREDPGNSRFTTAIIPVALGSSRILIIGLTYKKNVSDIRESPALKNYGTAGGKGSKGGLSRSTRASGPS